MAELSPESQATIRELMIEAQGKPKALEGVKSNKRKRRILDRALLKTLKVKHGEKCGECGVNCAVKHELDPDFWAIQEGKQPDYTLETCPKQGHLERYRIKMKKRVK